MNGGKVFPVCQAKAAICILCSVVFLFRAPARAEAATVTNYLNYPSPYSIAINVGDAVVWVNPYALTNIVESYGGEWKSPPLISGDSFSFTFTNAGFYAYKTRSDSPGFGAGTVTVVAWTDAPPAVTINTPVDGSVVGYGFLLQASVTNTEDPAQIEYFANGNLIRTATNAPYGVWWGSTPQVGCALVAKATDRQGRVTWSQPVNVTGGRLFDIWGPRLLPTGELLFFYNAFATQTSGYLSASDSPIFTNNACALYNYMNLGWVGQPGVFVDESVRGGAVPRRFYTVIWGQGGACP